jgi:hypothetical protein
VDLATISAETSTLPKSYAIQKTGAACKPLCKLVKDVDVMVYIGTPT